MNKYIAVSATLVLSFIMIGVPTRAGVTQGSPAKVMAKTMSNKTPEAKQEPLKPMKIWGTVVSFDAVKNQLTIKDRHEKTHELQLAADSKLTKGGNNEKIAGKDLRAGISVAVIIEGNAAKSVHWNVNAARVGISAQAKKK